MPLKTPRKVWIRHTSIIQYNKLKKKKLTKNNKPTTANQNLSSSVFHPLRNSPFSVQAFAAYQYKHFFIWLHSIRESSDLLFLFLKNEPDVVQNLSLRSNSKYWPCIVYSFTKAAKTAMFHCQSVSTDCRGHTRWVSWFYVTTSNLDLQELH